MFPKFPLGTETTGAKEKIDLIVQYLERNGHMSENYFEQILGGDDAETVDNFVERNPNDILVFGPNGKTVRARTANQKKAGDRFGKKRRGFCHRPRRYR